MFNRWTNANKQIARFLVQETARRNRQTESEMNKLRKNLTHIDSKLQHSPEAQELINQKILIQEIIQEKKDLSKKIKSNDSCLNQYLTEDMCSQQFFRKFKQANKQS